jgi:hydrogenase maturation protease
MSRRSGPLLVLGIGNVLCRDDGAGVEVVAALRQRARRGEVALPRGTRVVDGGTLGLALLPLVTAARAMLLVDAVELGLRPGAVRVLRGAELSRVTAGCRPGPGGLGELLATARLAGTPPAAVVLVGIEPAEIAAGVGMTDVVRAAIPLAAEMALRELRGLARLAPVGGRRRAARARPRPAPPRSAEVAA